jgi:DNA repair protein RadC
MQEHKYSIKQWAKDDQPREKLLAHGPSSLSHSELLAILIHNGTKDKNALELAKELMGLGNNNLTELGKLTVSDLMRIKGIGRAKAISIAAALELGRRRQAGAGIQKTIVSSSADIAQYFRSLFADHTFEVFAVVYLNRANRINHYEVISKGGMTGTVADPRIILKKALEQNAVGIILCHNHPSGNLHPSQSDKELTRKIIEAARYFDIQILDHIIVSDDGYFSFADEGLL